MNIITPNPLLGVGFHSVGAALSANCYSPQKYVKQWSWEVYWMAQASWCWLLWPILGAWLMRKNKSSGQFVQLPAGESGGNLTANYLLAFLTGTLWYGQFFFYNLGHVRLGKDYAFSSWAIHMIMLVLISNGVAVLFNEWRGCRRRTHGVLGIGLAVLCGAVILLTYGNYLGGTSN
jgi:L-rhamnose-H+ transport protein